MRCKKPSTYSKSTIFACFRCCGRATWRVLSVPNDYTVEKAAEVLLKHKLSVLPVVDRKGRLVGIITQTDMFRVIISMSKEERGHKEERGQKRNGVKEERGQISTFDKTQFMG
jgi:CBS-domain-containing membrane protein